MSGEEPKEIPKWFPRSRKAVVRRWMRQNGLKNPRDTMQLVRLTRQHPVLLQETEAERSDRRRKALDALAAEMPRPTPATLAEKLARAEIELQREQRRARAAGSSSGRTPSDVPP